MRDGGQWHWVKAQRQELDHGVRERPLEPNADDIRYVAAPADVTGDHEARLLGSVSHVSRLDHVSAGRVRGGPKARQYALRDMGIRAGSVWVNCYQAMDPAVPFGGYKMSGYGRESGLQQLEEYLNVKAVWIKTT